MSAPARPRLPSSLPTCAFGPSYVLLLPYTYLPFTCAPPTLPCPAYPVPHTRPTYPARPVRTSDTPRTACPPPFTLPTHLAHRRLSAPPARRTVIPHAPAPCPLPPYHLRLPHNAPPIPPPPLLLPLPPPPSTLHTYICMLDTPAPCPPARSYCTLTYIRLPEPCIYLFVCAMTCLISAPFFFLE